MKKINIILILLFVLYGCHTVKNNNNSMNDTDLYLKNWIVEQNQIKQIKTVLMDSMRTIENMNKFDLNDCVNYYRNQAISNLQSECLVKSDTIVFIEKGTGCFGPPDINNEIYVYCSYDKIITHFRFYNKLTYVPDRAVTESKPCFEKVQVQELDAISAILKNDLARYIKTETDKQKNECEYVSKYSIFTKRNNKFLFSKFVVRFGTKDCIQ